MSKDFKRINDPIHGLMEFESWIVAFIDTPHFQRLRNLKQLGTVNYVFPGATHTRFDHSLGVAYLTYLFVKRIQEKQPDYEDEKALKCVTLAALCHDLGHGPFSHMFEREFIKKHLGRSELSHEKFSVKIFKDLLEYLKHDKKDYDYKKETGLDENDEKFIQALIVGDSANCQPNRQYLFDVVANERNSIDVDKLDYLARDCHYVGTNAGFDFSRLTKFSRVVEGQIAYYFKESYNIYQLFNTRYSLFKRVYTHRVSKAIDFMIIDALIAADSVFEISDSIDDPKRYLKLDDTILNRIEYLDPEKFSSEKEEDLRKKEDLIKSQKIINRIRTRDLYKFVDDFLVTKEKKSLYTKKKIDAAAIIEGNDQLEEDDVIVEVLKLNFGKGDKNPVEYVKFFKKDDDEIVSLTRAEVSYLVTDQFEEINVQIFARKPEKVEIIKECFNRLLIRHGLR